MRAAAVAELERMAQKLERLRARESELILELEAVRVARTELETESGALERFTDPRPNEGPVTARRLRVVDRSPSVPEREQTLRGAEIRVAAVRLLVTEAPDAESVHYRDWFALLTSAGFTPAGKDPLATFLTQISRSPVVQKTTTAGRYSLDREFPARAREDLRRLRAELDDARSDAGASVDEMELARGRRRDLEARVQAVQRSLDEATTSLVAAGERGEHG